MKTRSVAIELFHATLRRTDRHDEAHRVVYIFKNICCGFVFFPVKVKTSFFFFPRNLALIEQISDVNCAVLFIFCELWGLFQLVILAV